eukprot:3965922-Alexandrium_andersonii.AAC.1
MCIRDRPSTGRSRRPPCEWPSRQAVGQSGPRPGPSGRRRAAPTTSQHARTHARTHARFCCARANF